MHAQAYTQILVPGNLVFSSDPRALCAWKPVDLAIDPAGTLTFLFGLPLPVMSATDLCYRPWPGLLTKIMPTDLLPHCQHIANTVPTLACSYLPGCYQTWLVPWFLASAHAISLSPSSSSLWHLHPSTSLADPVCSIKNACMGIVQQATLVILSTTVRCVCFEEDTIFRPSFRHPSAISIVGGHMFATLQLQGKLFPFAWCATY